jgi:hypothetical protein
MRGTGRCFGTSSPKRLTGTVFWCMLAFGAEYIGSVGDSQYLAARVAKERILRIVPLPECEAQGIANAVSTQLAQRERDARNERRRKGLTMLGADAVRKQHWRKMPKTGARLFGLTPTFAAARRLARIGALAAVKKFRREYRAALTSYRRVLRDVQFPHGTWMMSRMFGAVVGTPLPTITYCPQASERPRSGPSGARRRPGVRACIR